jgi:formylglycine-generating enzyme required for sulfatase activity
VRRTLALVPLLAACHNGGSPAAPDRGEAAAPLSRAADAEMIAIPAGRYVAGSTPEERALAYDDYLATSGHDAARAGGWFDVEEERHVDELPGFRIDLLPVTQAQYAEFVATGAAPAPAVEQEAWEALGLQQPWSEVVRFVWTDGRPPGGREEHPVVLVSHDDAAAYCAWRGDLVGATRRLPTAAEYEKAARGDGGLSYPWGQAFEADKLNSGVGGPRDTVPVGSFPAGKSPYGVLDLAGNAFAWTSTPWPPGAGDGAAKRTVKGSGWEDWAGVGRGASWHGRARRLRHVIIGFRCAGDA